MKQDNSNIHVSVDNPHDLKNKSPFILHLNISLDYPREPSPKFYYEKIKDWDDAIDNEYDEWRPNEINSNGESSNFIREITASIKKLVKEKIIEYMTVIGSNTK